MDKVLIKRELRLEEKDNEVIRKHAKTIGCSLNAATISLVHKGAQLVERERKILEAIS